MTDDNEDMLLRSVALQNAESIRIARQRAEQHAEATLREQANLLDLTHDSIIVRDMNGAIRYWNRAAEELYGWKREEAVGKLVHHLLDTVFPAPVEQIEAEVVREGRWEGELVHTKKDGSQVVVASRWSLQRQESGPPLAILETNNDITERKRAEQARQEIEEQWRAAFESNPTMYFIVDAAGIIVSVNAFGAEQLGYRVTELVGQPVSNVFYEADRQAVARHAKTCLEQPGRMLMWEARKIRKNGTMLWVRERAKAVVLKKRPVLLVVCEDVTEQKRAEEQLRAAETRFRAYVDHATDALFVHDEQGRIVDVNHQACASLGYTREELIGLTQLDFDPAGDEASREWISERLDAGEIVAFEASHRRKDGTVFPVEVRLRPFRHSGHRFALSLARDITERKRAEEERERVRQLQADLAHINRVTTMGELTASLAHEVNQPIAAAVTNANTCERWLAGEAPKIEEAREAAKRTVQNVKRAAEIIGGIRSLFKKSATRHELIDVNEVIIEMIALVRSEASRWGVSIQTELTPDLPRVTADRVQLQQVLMNLMINGIEAMKALDRSRELTLTSERDGLKSIRVSVSDTGVGLPAGGDEIFNAFFTTKADGTGMGLAISRSITESHGGRLWATSNSGGGAIFHLSLPVISTQ